MDDPYADRTELEEMVAASPLGEIFFAPTVTAEGCFWSFLVHDRNPAIESVCAMADGEGRVGECAEALFVLVQANTDEAQVPVIALLFKFETDPPVVYSVFMNPMEPNVRELLDDISRQEELVVEFFDEQRVNSVTLENRLGPSILDALSSLPDLEPSTGEAYDLVVDELLAKHPEPMSLWNRLRSTRGDGR